MWCVCYYCPILSEVSFARQGLLKIPNIKFYQIFVQWDPSCSYRATDRQKTRRDEINNRFLQLIFESTKMSAPSGKQTSSRQ